MKKSNKIVSKIARMSFLLFAVLFVISTVMTMTFPAKLGDGGLISQILFCIGLLTVLLAWANHKGWFSHVEGRARCFITSPAVRALSVAVLVFIITGAVFTIMSLHSSPYSPNWGNKSEYENTVRVLGFASILLGLLLSALEQNVYWISRLKSTNLDERQIKERQGVFETSYKLYVIILLLFTWFFADSIINNLQKFIANNAATTPGMLIWLPVNAVVLGFAIPLIVAAWQKR